MIARKPNRAGDAPVWTTADAASSQSNCSSEMRGGAIVHKGCKREGNDSGYKGGRTAGAMRAQVALSCFTVFL